MKTLLIWLILVSSCSAEWVYRARLGHNSREYLQIFDGGNEEPSVVVPSYKVGWAYRWGTGYGSHVVWKNWHILYINEDGNVQDDEVEKMIFVYAEGFEREEQDGRVYQRTK